MARSKRTAYSVRADILQSLRWSTMANHLGFRSVAAWLTSLAENGVHDFDEAIYTMSRRRKELYAISEEEEREKPLKVNVRRAYRVELDRLFQLAISVPELPPSNQRVFMEKGEFNRWLFEVMNTVTLVAERRGRILGFLYATLEETLARIVFLAVLPEYRRRGIGTALHHELKVHIPREVSFVGVYALLDSPVIPFLERSGTFPASSICGWIATLDPILGPANRRPSSLPPTPSPGRGSRSPDGSFRAVGTDTSSEPLRGQCPAGPVIPLDPAVESLHE